MALNQFVDFVYISFIVFLQRRLFVCPQLIHDLGILEIGLAYKMKYLYGERVEEMDICMW